MTQPATNRPPDAHYAADWAAIKEASLAGLLLAISIEMAGLDRRDDVAAREARLTNLRRAYERARTWQP